MSELEKACATFKDKAQKMGWERAQEVRLANIYGLSTSTAREIRETRAARSELNNTGR